METMIPADDPVRLLSAFVEGMDLSEVYATYDRVRKNQATPRQMLKIMIYAAMNRLFSSRDIETACRRDINFMFLLEGAPAPDHATFARFRSIHFAPCSKRILAEMSNALFDLGEVSGETIFIDGTKIEASANKYTFVWKKAVTKNQEKLLIKLADFVAECEQLYDIKIVYGSTIKMKHIKKLRKKLYALKKSENVLYLRSNSNTPDIMQVQIETPGGSIFYDVHVIKINNYTIDDIFDKELYFYIPFYIFTFEPSFGIIEKDKEKLEQLKDQYDEIVHRLEKACKDGKITEKCQKEGPIEDGKIPCDLRRCQQTKFA